MKYLKDVTFLALVESHVKTLSEGYSLRGYTLTENLKKHILLSSISLAEIEFEMKIIEDLRNRGLSPSEIKNSFIEETGTDEEWAERICTSEF